MKKNHLLVAFLSIGLFLGSCGSKKENKEGEAKDGEKTEEVKEEASNPEFKSEAGKFSIQFKQTPKESVEDVPTAVGNIKMYMFMYEESATKAYMAAYCDYPEELVANGDAKSMLDGSKNGVLGQFQATITKENAGKFMGHESLDFTADGPQYNTAYKLVLAKNRLYQIGILQSGGSVTQEDIDAFIGTFKINE